MPPNFILGPSLDNVIEPIPSTQPAPPATEGKRGIAFDSPPTSPGGNVHVTLLPAVAPTDALPANVYAFFCQPVSGVPALADRTPDWFFNTSGAPNSSIHIGAATPDGKLTVTVPGVKPSLQPYFVQTILEY